MLHKTKQNVAYKNMESQTMHHGTKMCKFKKNLTIMVNVYKLSVSIPEEKKILYPSPPPPPPFTIITTTTTMMDLSRPSIEKNQK
jgi:hypothetical protein